MRQIIILTTLLSILAFLGNAASLPLFYGVDFIFGSIFVMYAAMTLGRYCVMVIAVVAGLYTYYLWGHMYAAIIFFVEALWLAEGWRRGYRNTVVIDFLYWILLGLPLVIFCYSQLLSLGVNTSGLIALKQTLNGMFNVAIASLLYFLIEVVIRKQKRIGMQPLLFNTVLILTLVSGSVPAVLSSHKASNGLEVKTISDMQVVAKQVEYVLKGESFKGDYLEINNLVKPYEVDVTLQGDNETVYQTNVNLPNFTDSYRLVKRGENINIWLPENEQSVMKQWQGGWYTIEIDVQQPQNNLQRIIILKAAAPIVHQVNTLKAELFLILVVIMLGAIFVSYFLSKLFTYPVELLNSAGKEMTQSITDENLFKLPYEYIKEYSNFSETLDNLASQVRESYQSLQQEKDSLVAIVDESTDKLKLMSIVASRTTNGVVITNPDGEIEWINDAFIKLTGYELDEVLGQKPGRVLQGDATDQETVSRISEKLAMKEGFSEDIINYSKNKKPYWVHVDCDPIFEGDELIGFMAIESDITDRKENEETLIKRTAELNAVLNAATEISVITTDTNGLITMFNAGAEKMLGYQASEMVGKETPAKIHLMEEVRIRGLELSSALKKEIEGFRVFVELPEMQGSETREWTYITKDGSFLTVILSVTTVKSSDGRVIGYLGVAQDITERKQLEEMKNEFVSTVSHELRTPLTAINGTLRLITGGVTGELQDKTRELLDIASGNTERLTLLINDLLDMEKIASGKMEFNLRRHDLADMVRRSIKMNESYVNQFDVKISLRTVNESYNVRVDENRLLQVLSNFISNAAKFSDPGSSIDVYIDDDIDRVRVSVQDYGPGISKEFATHIFDKFSQADSSDTRSIGGTGLGLAISRELIRNMGGSIGFDSEVGHGATFWFELPLSIEE